MPCFKASVRGEAKAPISSAWANCSSINSCGIKSINCAIGNLFTNVERSSLCLARLSASFANCAKPGIIFLAVSSAFGSTNPTKSLIKSEKPSAYSSGTP